MPKDTPEPQLIDRDAFLNAGKKRRTTIVDVPGLGAVKIRSLREKERAQYEGDTLDDFGDVQKEKVITAKRRLICLAVVDANGEPLLEPGDVAALGEMDSAIVNELFRHVSDFTGISKGDIADLVGNSKTTREDDSR